MVKKALVINADEKTAELKIKRECACSNSQTCEKSCFALSEDIMLIKVGNKIGVKKGDLVELSAKSSLILFYSFCVFIIPITLAFISCFFVSSFNSIFLYVIPVFTFFATLIILCFMLNRYAKNNNDFEITGILQQTNTNYYNTDKNI